MAPTPIPLDPELAKRAGIHLGPGESAFRENSSTIILPTKDVAFLNPVQEFNRDISTLVIKTWGIKTEEERRKRWEAKRARKQSQKGETLPGHAGKRRKVQHSDGQTSAQPSSTQNGSSSDQTLNAQGDDVREGAGQEEDPSNQESEPFRFTVLEALAATGLRSIRYAKEIPNLKWVLANDLSSTAVQAMKRNLAINFPAGRPLEAWEPDPDNPTTSTVAATIAAAKGAKSSPSKDKLRQVGDVDSARPLDNELLAAPLTSSQLTELEDAAANGDADATRTLAAWRKGGRQKLPSAPGSSESDPSPPVKETLSNSDKPSSSTPEIHPDCKVRPHEGDAIVLQYMHREPSKRFHVIDLDPYGSASSFIDGAVQAVADGGLLCVTCTDLAILAGNNYPEKCFSQYGGINVRSDYSHEAALRLVLHSISTSAARYSRYIRPLLSLSIDFYLRVFVEVRTSPVETKRAASQTGLVHVCSQCQSYHQQPFGKVVEVQNEKRGTSYTKFGGSPSLVVGPECTECGGRVQTAGPMWLARIHDPSFCRRVLDELEANPLRFHTAPRIKGMVTSAANELEDALFYFIPSKISGLFRCENPTLKIVVSSLLQAGFEVSRSHCAPGSLKTNATRAQVFDFFRSWIAKRSPVNLANIKPGSPTRKLLAKPEARKALLERRAGLSKHSAEGATSEQAATTESSMLAESSTDDVDEEPHPSAMLGYGDGGGPAPLDFEIVDNHERTEEVLASGEKLVRYQVNPLPNWGPGKAARVNKSRTGKSSASQAAPSSSDA